MPSPAHPNAPRRCNCVHASKVPQRRDRAKIVGANADEGGRAAAAAALCGLARRPARAHGRAGLQLRAANAATTAMAATTSSTTTTTRTITQATQMAAIARSSVNMVGPMAGGGIGASPPRTRVVRGVERRAQKAKRIIKGLRDRNSPKCTLSQNGYGDWGVTARQRAINARCHVYNQLWPRPSLARSRPRHTTLGIAPPPQAMTTAILGEIAPSPHDFGRRTQSGSSAVGSA